MLTNAASVILKWIFFRKFVINLLKRISILIRFQLQIFYLCFFFSIFCSNNMTALGNFKGTITESFLKKINPHWLHFPPQTESAHYILATIYFIMMVFGLFGNALVIYIYIRYGIIVHFQCFRDSRDFAYMIFYDFVSPLCQSKYHDEAREQVFFMRVLLRKGRRKDSSIVNIIFHWKK